MEGRWPDYAVPAVTSEDFERYIGTLFADLGYDVYLPPPKSSFGADLILIRPITNEQSVVVTRFLSEGLVGSDAVQQAASAVLAWGAAKGWVVTNARCFSENAFRLALSDGIRLVDRDGLKGLVTQVGGTYPDPRRAAPADPLASATASVVASLPAAAPSASATPPMPGTSQPIASPGTAHVSQPLAPAGAASVSQPLTPAGTAHVSQPLAPADPFAPSYPVSAAAPSGAPYASMAGSAAPSMPDMGADQMPQYMQPYPLQYAVPEKNRAMGCLISILATLAVIALLLAAYVFLAPPLFDAIEEQNPGIHIVRFDDILDAVLPS